MHWPNVLPRTATPPATKLVWGMIATSVIPGIAWTAARLRTALRLPLIVGGRHSIVGSAPGTSRSIANCLRPVTASSASIRRCGVPTSLSCDCGLSFAAAGLLSLTAAFDASEPNVTLRPSGAVITPSDTPSIAGRPPSSAAAACSNWPRAIAAATRTGV